MLTDFTQTGDWLSTLNYIKFYNFEMKFIIELCVHSFLTRKRNQKSE